MTAMSPAESDVAPKTIGGTTSGVLSCKEGTTNDRRLIIAMLSPGVSDYFFNVAFFYEFPNVSVQYEDQTF